MLATRPGLTKAIAIIPVTKKSHIMSGLKPLLFIQVIPAFPVGMKPWSEISRLTPWLIFNGKTSLLSY
jgi:hypothetical protein